MANVLAADDHSSDEEDILDQDRMVLMVVENEVENEVENVVENEVENEVENVVENVVKNNPR